jgi:hypothetical protein
MRLTVPKFLAVVFGAALGGYVFLVAPHMPGGTRPLATRHAAKNGAISVKPDEKAGVFPPAGKKFVGIMTSDGPYNYGTLDKFTAAVGRLPSVYEFSQGWAVNKFNVGVISRVADRGMLPLISWEPWNYHLMPIVDPLRDYQPAYRLSRIIGGHYDSYIRSWAEGIKALRYTVAIRFAQEMNGYWYPWGVANGNKPGQYVRAWRHVHDIFTKVGATNVIWIWAPNVMWNNSPNLAQFYPGNNYVTWIGLSGYYGTPGMGDYRTFNEIFGPTISDLRGFTHKPIVIAETGATEVSGQMSRWIKEMFRELPAHKGIIGIVWFEAVDVVDWRVASYSQAAAAFSAGYASPLYHVRWSPGMTALLTLSGK